MSFPHSHRGYALVCMALFLCVISASLPILHERFSVLIDLEKQAATNTKETENTQIVLTQAKQLVACGSPTSPTFSCSLNLELDQEPSWFDVKVTPHGKQHWRLKVKKKGSNHPNLNPCERFLR